MKVAEEVKAATAKAEEEIRLKAEEDAAAAAAAAAAAKAKAEEEEAKAEAEATATEAKSEEKEEAAAAKAKAMEKAEEVERLKLKAEEEAAAAAMAKAENVERLKAEEEAAAKAKAEEEANWPTYGDMLCACVAEDQRRLPVAPVKFDASTTGAHFANPADLPLVQGMYADAFGTVVGKTRVLHFKSMPWISAEEWLAFVEHALPLCGSLEELSLMDNEELDVDVEVLVGKLCPCVRALYLDGTSCYGDGGAASWAKLAGLEKLHLKGTCVGGDVREVVAALPATLQELRLKDTPCEGNCPEAPWARLGALKYLDLTTTRVTGRVEDLVAALPGEELEALHLRRTGLFGDPAAAPWARLPKLGWLDLKGTRVDPISIAGIRAAGVDHQCAVELSVVKSRSDKYGAWKVKALSASSSNVSLASSEGPGKAERRRRRRETGRGDKAPRPVVTFGGGDDISAAVPTTTEAEAYAWSARTRTAAWTTAWPTEKGTAETEPPAQP